MPRVKGSIMLPLVKGLRSTVKNARELLRPELHRYLDERILVTSWYPEEEHLELLRVVGGAMGIGPGGSYVPMGVVLAQFELGGVYRGSLRPGDAERTLRAFVNLWPQNHDTGAMELTERREGGDALSLADYAMPAREVCDIVTGYVIEGLRMADVKVVATHPKCRARGAAICIWDINTTKTAAP
jgi:hypothetical protein